MPKPHSTRTESGDFNLTVNNDGSWPWDSIKVAILADNRRRLSQLVTLTEGNQRLAQEQLRVLRRIDRRLAKRIKLR